MAGPRKVDEELSARMPCLRVYTVCFVGLSRLRFTLWELSEPRADQKLPGM